MHNQFKIYCFVAYTLLNMFRALLCPLSGASSPTAFAASDYRLQRQLEGPPDDGHNSARNMLSGLYATKQ
jgi:hypothetical protein